MREAVTGLAVTDSAMVLADTACTAREFAGGRRHGNDAYTKAASDERDRLLEHPDQEHLPRLLRNFAGIGRSTVSPRCCCRKG